MLEKQSGRVLGFQLYSSAIYLIAQVSILYASLSLTNGKLIYTLDDPYIHLAVAESILEGGYGINPSEYASPSSSILYPFILAFGLSVGLGEFAPLIFSTLFSLAAIWVLSGFVWLTLDPRERYSTLVFIILGPSLVLAINAVALPMTGMEHSIHVFGTVLALTGLYYLSQGIQERTAIAAALIGTLVCATIRFEGLSLFIAMIGSLYALGFRVHALLAASVIISVLSLYAWTMASLGLPIFPSSVMTKSDIAAQTSDGNIFGLMRGVLSNTWHGLNERWGVLFALAATFFLAFSTSTKPTQSGVRVLFLSCFFILSAHVIAGRYGWFGRYEVYAVAAMLIGFFSTFPYVYSLTSTKILVPVAVFVVGAPYFMQTIKTPEAAANIYQQQYQMHRFAQEFFPYHVAVNDLGYVAFGNQGYVLDLWGLGSEEARRFSQNNKWSPELLSEITARNDITYAMIYIRWFREVPEDWCHIGNLVTSQVTSASDTVSFYLIQREKEDVMRAALQAFSAELPEGARMDVLDCSSSQ